MMLPKAKMINMPHEISLAERVVQMRHTCGTNEIVVSVPAMRPSIS